VEPQQIGATFQSWLLHVTIVPWFRLDAPSDVIARGLQEALLPIVPFEVQVNDQAMLGPRKNRPAMMIAQPTRLTGIEQKVRSYLHKKRAWLVDETTKRKYNFRPHVTTQGERALQPGDKFYINRLYIVEQKGDYKEIMSEIHLGK
jgi:2'-5' RNA ligase